ncbi:ornithine cyclodeaminase family protein [Candidatus Cryosericum septentrionale]|jgi:alanine dehydrogenase|uniref:Ornithine cyclodeaminase family protein n=1 Tax=Candidatus Cryosericum septentrionale TaxID=2290913 RepID=A0A398DK02_9BACT|nr:ornithine cyclodeaminase family protein [Candidatus Cryosericum septentrionale]RIE15485.1 ornithine cyclodeaminase family protein [Candidatus Cryosericum septentrionale]
MKTPETLLLNQEQIKSLITMKEVVEIVDRTSKDLGVGKTINPTKVLLDLGETAAYPPYSGFMNAMPAYIGWEDSAGIKWAGGFLGERKALGFPYITAMILLIDPKLGFFRAAMDGAYITNMRTGAQTASALKYLVNKKKIKLGLYGAGMQGHTQTEAISVLFDIDELRVYDVNRQASEKFAQDMKDVVKGKIIIADKPEDAAQGDVIVCVTQSKDKFLKNEWIKPGTVVFPMGSYQECDDEFILSADKIIVDCIGQVLHRGALRGLVEEKKLSEKNITCTIGEMAAGLKEERIQKNERILCLPIGTGAMDVAVATAVYNKAVEKSIGVKFAFV